MDFLIGTYTNPGYSTSKGIYKSSIKADGSFGEINLAATSENPSYLAKDVDNKFMICVNSKEKGTITSYKKNKNKLVKIDEVQVGNNPCFVEIKDQLVFTANYKSGDFFIHKTEKNGCLTYINQQQHIADQKLTHPRQDGPHAHSCYLSPNLNTIISVDLGINKLLFWELKNGKIVKKSPNNIELPNASGPRHLAFHPTLPVVYVVNELSSTLSILKQNKQGYDIDTTINTLPKSYKGENTSAHIVVSDDAHFLYLSNRGHDSIAVFKIDKLGSLKLIEHVDVEGNHPRHFALSKDQKFLIVANRDSNNICSFKRNLETGKLLFVDKIQASRATCILF